MEPQIPNLIASDLFTAFINKLNVKQIDYVILRNYEKLPDDNSSKDIDFLIRKKQINTISNILIEIAKQNNYKLIKTNKLDYLHGYIFVKIEDDVVYSVKIDLFIDLTWRGMHFCNTDLIIKHKQSFKNFFIPAKGHEAFISIIYYLLYAKKIRDKYHNKIHILSNDVINFKQICIFTYNCSLYEKIINLISKKDITSLYKIRKTIIKQLIQYNLKNNPLFIFQIIKHVISEINFKRKKGKFIVFLGPDGSGKSTILNEVFTFFRNLGMVSDNEPGHFLPAKIPSLHKLKIAPEKYKKQDYTKPYQAKPAGILGSYLRLAYYFIAFLYGYIFCIKNRLKYNNIVFYDRYFYDMVVDPLRFRINVSSGFAKRLFKLNCKPEIIVIIKALPEIILSRKKELTEDKIEELTKNYTSLVSDYNEAVICENNFSIAYCSLSVLDQIFESTNEFVK